MVGIKLQKRKDDFFVSYGHADVMRVAPLVDFLKRTCGLSVWFDGVEGNASVRSSKLLSGAIGNSRGALFCVSETWKRSTWCEGEFEVALTQQREFDGFEIVAIQLDNVDPPDWLKVSEIIDMRQPNGKAIGRLLKSLGSDPPHRFDNAEDVYLAAPWSRPSPLVRDTFEVVRRMGWRLVGDTPTFKHLGEGRIAAIQRTTRGVVALLPHDPHQPGTATSPYILEEARLASTIGKPLLLLSEPEVVLPDDLPSAAFRHTAIRLGATADDRAALAAALADFDELLHHSPHDDSGAFIFFAASLRGDPSETEDIATVIERASNMQCVRGERLSGDNAQSAIIDLIRRAAVVIADVSDDHRNTLIETGIAMGSGTRLKLMCREPADGTTVKKRFMFEGQEFHWYRSAEERLGLGYYFARQFRRRVYVVR
jgi:hypothetical protein